MTTPSQAPDADHTDTAAADPLLEPQGGRPLARREGVRRRCTALSRRSGERCRNAPVLGATVCRMHGGAASQVRAAAERRRREQALAAAAVTYGLPVDISPTEALLEEVRWTAGHVRWLRDRIQELERGQLTWGRVEYREKAGDKDAGWTEVEKAGPHVLLELYDRERQRLVDVTSAALRAGIEERRVRLAEGQGEMVAQALRRSLDGILSGLVQAGLNLALQQRWQALVAEVVPRELRALGTRDQP
jgi:hypothetical protein